MNYVLDACAMIAYLRNEPGAAVVDGLLQSPDNRCFAHSINLCEVYYDFIRASDEPTAREAIADLFHDGVVERKDLSRDFWFGVGQLKSRHRLSLADCHCVLLARRVDGEVVTSDHHEFDPLDQLGLCKVRFIR
jgi:PIN domain nuclease of toxin-antitoxin system